MIHVAIDGPAGAGKSTIARAAAARLGYVYIDTGALYRTVGVFAMQQGVDIEDPAEIEKVLEKNPQIEMRFADGEQRMFLNGTDVSEAIRLPQASMAASKVSAVAAVRKYLFDLQRNIAQKNNCLMDGRDIGTVVLPHAQVKIFLFASAEVRAQRRLIQLQEKGIESSFEQVYEEMVQRDYDDSHRAIAPLKQAEDAVLLDTSHLTLEESIELVMKTVLDKIQK